MHDLVRDAVHLSWDRIAELRQSPACGGNVAWIVWLRPRGQFRALVLSIQEFQVLQASPILLTVDVSRDEK